MLKNMKNGLVPSHCVRKCIQFIICWLAFTPICSHCESLVGPEYEVKMGFIYNFARFVTWPKEVFSDSDDTLNFCFFSDHPAAGVLFKLNGQAVQNRKLTVRKIESDVTKGECHILFFGTDNETFISRTLATIRGQHILSIGEVDGFAQMGGVINFFNQNNRLRFEVNRDATKRENLKFSAQLLQAAQRIVKETKEDRKAQAAEIKKLKQSQQIEQLKSSGETIKTDLSDVKEKNGTPNIAK
jgi:hypothetical protein